MKILVGGMFPRKRMLHEDMLIYRRRFGKGGDAGCDL